METVKTLEANRQLVQTQLDTLKPRKERNRLGQFATPYTLAADILTYAKRLLPPGVKVSFLDPAIGTGSFYSALLQNFSPVEIVRAIGYEIDPHFGNEALDLWKETGLQLYLTDFTKATPPKSNEVKANLLICNPPYVRHHHLTRDEKTRLQGLIANMEGIRLSELAGFYCYFLLLSHAWMAENCLAGWLIPSEFMDVNYGAAIKTYLLDRVTLLRIHRFDPNEVQFDDALVSSAVVWFRKAPPPADHTVEFSYGRSLINPSRELRVPTAILRDATKWTKFPLATNKRESSSRRLKLSDLFTVKRGLATGSNEYFILTMREVQQYALPSKFLIPILPSARYLRVNEIYAEENGEPRLENKLYLLSCDLPEKRLIAEYPSLWMYLQNGIKAGVDQAYLCKHRNPWYSQEKRDVAPILCTYMGRSSRASSNPFRFILNHSQAIASNTYLLLYPNYLLQQMVQGNPERMKKVWEALNQITSEVLIEEGRVYGGGLHKLEPKELANISADGIFAALSDLPEPHEVRFLYNQPQLPFD